MLWLWHSLAATAPIIPLAWETPYAMGMALEKAQRQKKKIVPEQMILLFFLEFIQLLLLYMLAQIYKFHYSLLLLLPRVFLYGKT